MITSPGATSRVTVTTLTVDFSRRASSPCACVHRKPEKPTVTTATAIATPATAASLRSLRVPPAAGPRCLRAVEAPAVDVVLWPPCAGLGAAAGICVDVVAPMAASCAMARSSSWAERLLAPAEPLDAAHAPGVDGRAHFRLDLGDFCPYFLLGPFFHLYDSFLGPRSPLNASGGKWFALQCQVILAALPPSRTNHLESLFC